jgi:hypothetical protein
VEALDFTSSTNSAVRTAFQDGMTEVDTKDANPAMIINEAKQIRLFIV